MWCNWLHVPKFENKKLFLPVGKDGWLAANACSSVCVNILEIHEIFTETSPSEATSLGIHDYNEEVEDMSVHGLKNILEKCQHFKDLSSQIINNKSYVRHLDFKDKFYLKILHREVEECLHFSGHKGYLLAQGSFLFGLQTTLPNSFGRDTHFKLVGFEETKIYRVA